MKNGAFLSALALVLFLTACQNATNSAAEIAQKSATPGIDTATGLPIPLPNVWKTTTCDLLTDEEFHQIFAVEDKRDFANRRTLENYCLRTWKKPDWRDREVKEAHNPNIAANPESALAISVLHYGTEAMAVEQMNTNKRDHVNGYSEDVPNLGDAALWSDSQGLLIFKKGATCIQIQLSAFDNVHDNLPKAIEVAKAALAKMK